MVGRGRWNIDIVVLFRAFSDIASYEDALTAAAIPCYTVQGRGFYGRREVIDLVALLAAVDDPRDSLRLAAALRSPFFALSDDCLLELGLRLHERSATPRFNSLAEMFAAAVPDFSGLDLAGLGGERDGGPAGLVRAPRVARVARPSRAARDGRAGARPDRLRKRDGGAGPWAPAHRQFAQGGQLAHRFDARRFFTFHDFVAYLRRLTEAEPYEPQARILGEIDDVVRLMTSIRPRGSNFRSYSPMQGGCPTRRAARHCSILNAAS